MSQLLIKERIDHHILFVTLNRPEAANALNQSLLHELNKLVDEVNDDHSVRAVIITGANKKVFSAGADLKERSTMTDDEVVSAVTYIGDTINRIAQMNIPVIAALNGSAYGGGLELALACDFRIASAHISLGLTETSLAIIPGAGGTQRLARLIGLGQAKRLIFSAERVEAEEALSLGIVEKVANDAGEEAIQIARRIIQNGPIALKQAKIALDKGYDVDMQTGLQIEHLSYMQTIQTEDRTEGLVAFKEKRKPIYKGK